jgi:hypothetical protein
MSWEQRGDSVVVVAGPAGRAGAVSGQGCTAMAEWLRALVP